MVTLMAASFRCLRKKIALLNLSTVAIFAREKRDTVSP